MQTINFFNKKAFFCLLLIIFALPFSGCGNETEILEIDYGYDYFPLQSGKWIEYEVDSILFSSFLEGGRDTIKTQVREVIGDSFVDNEGRPATTIERYVRYDFSQAWEDVTPTIWYAIRTDQLGERVEGELRFIKLTFPVLEGAKWFGNSYINTSSSDLAVLDGWQYVYTEVNEERTFNNLNFPQATTIVQNNFDTYIEKIYSEEVYARGVGLVYKEEWRVKSGNTLQVPSCCCRCACVHAPTDCGNCQNTEGSCSEASCSPAQAAAECPWPGVAQSGFIMVMKVLDYQR